MGLVSIIVPIYNKEKELRKCIDSLINQSYKNLEIILVNDGSNDKSLEICEKYRNKDSRIKILNKINEGVELTRYAGLKIANGEFVNFVDADDWLPLNAIELLVNNLIENESDISFGSYNRVVLNEKLIISKRIYKFDTITHDDFMKNHIQSYCGWGDFPINVWGKLYKKSLLMKIKPIGITYGEDLCFNLQALPNAKKISCTPELVYYYRWGGMTSNLNEKVITDAFKQYQIKVDFYKNLNRYDCIEMSNVELLNYFLTYVESCVDKEKNEDELVSKIIQYLNNKILENAAHNITFSWIVASPIYNAVIEKNIKKIIKIKSKGKNKRKLKLIIANYITKLGGL